MYVLNNNYIIKNIFISVHLIIDIFFKLFMLNLMIRVIT